MSSRGGRPGGAWVRRVVQVLSLVLFVGVVIAARPHAGEEPAPWLHVVFHLDPLVVLATALSAHAVVAGAALALVVVAVTLVFGRVFCGWVCPLGTLQDIAGRVFDRWQGKHKHRDHWSPWQRTKYYLLAGFLVMAALGAHWVCIFDPLVLSYRSLTTAVLPAVQTAVEDASTPLAQSPNKRVQAVAKYTSEPVYALFRDHVFVVHHQGFLGAGLIGGLLVGLLLLTGYRRRFWCRYLCPLGGLLGLLSGRPLLRRAVQQESCNQCDLCGMACHGAAAAAPGTQWKAAECLGCLNCTRACRRASLKFTWAMPWRRQPAVESVDLSKRALLGAALGGVATMALVRSTPQARGAVFNPDLLRPPGARAERDFLQRCLSCGLCMKICPRGALQPTLAEAGLEGLWTPMIVPKIAACDIECTLCGQVCPTEAIVRLTVDERREVRIGLASFDVTRCIPYAYGRDCVVCEECCPIPDKAIYTLDVTVVDRDGNQTTIRQPHVDPTKCVGCGECVKQCPYQDRPGVRVTSANESRHPKNQPILGGGSSDPYGGA